MVDAQKAREVMGYASAHDIGQTVRALDDVV
jgi:hypothetical protein